MQAHLPTVYLQITCQSTVRDPAVHAPLRTIVSVDCVSSPARVIPTGDLQELCTFTTAFTVIGKCTTISSRVLSLAGIDTLPHCLSTNNDKGYGGIGCINFACTRVKAARVVVITAVTDYAT